SPVILEHTQRLVLQPQSYVFLLRSYLMEMGWRIVAEDIAFESGFYYEIMAAEKGHMDLTDEEIEFGPFLLAQRHPLLIPFLQLKRADLAILI
ncbi:MAG: tRNA (adenine(22)-N(1))-methyltransferase TrmK, partial [Clostridiales bacterium]